MIDSPTDNSDSPTAARRKREIAEAARAELMEKGVEGLRMRAIADRAGINVATLHYHANGKDGLIELVAQSIVDDFREQHARTPRDGWTALERLAQELRDFRELRMAKPDIHHVMATLSRRASTDEGIARHITPMRARWHANIMAVLEDGKSDGSLRADLDAESGARIIIWTILAMGAPDQLTQHFSNLAEELLRAFASDTKQDFKGFFDDSQR